MYIFYDYVIWVGSFTISIFIHQFTLLDFAWSNLINKVWIFVTVFKEEPVCDYWEIDKEDLQSAAKFVSTLNFKVPLHPIFLFSLKLRLNLNIEVLIPGTTGQVLSFKNINFSRFPSLTFRSRCYTIFFHFTFYHLPVKTLSDMTRYRAQGRGSKDLSEAFRVFFLAYWKR